MEISAEELSLLATIIANRLSQNLDKRELINVKCFLSQVANNIGFILSVDVFSKKVDKKDKKRE